jgi:hypothetical protein
MRPTCQGRILKSAKADDLPVEQPTRFRSRDKAQVLVIKLKWQRRSGLPSRRLLGRADEVIE